MPKPFSFDFAGKNSRKDFGIIATSYDFLMPPKRARRQLIPSRDGTYDYGAEHYDDRALTLRCVWLSTAEHTRDSMREVAYWLSKKSRLVLDIEPDKYYMAEIYDPSSLEAHYIRAHDMRTTDGSFELLFTCDPFAYAIEPTTLQAVDNVINMARGDDRYPGTRAAPTRIMIKNNGDTPIYGIQIITRTAR